VFLFFSLNLFGYSIFSTATAQTVSNASVTGEYTRDGALRYKETGDFVFHRTELARIYGRSENGVLLLDGTAISFGIFDGETKVDSSVLYTATYANTQSTGSSFDFNYIINGRTILTGADDFSNASANFKSNVNVNGAQVWVA
jgi:hypothetical protein